MRNRFLATVGLVVLALGLGGGQCTLKEVVVQLPDFETSEVEGLWFHRLDEETGEYVREGQIVFEEVYVKDGAETVDYTTIDPDGEEIGTLDALIARDLQNPDEVTLRLWYLRWFWDGHGRYKVSAFNAAGESPLTDEDTLL